MKRSELYEQVWSMPMTKLAQELGISDVGLAKACRRHAVPAPPRGYWAKLRAGQKPPKTPLPAPELDTVVHFATSDPAERARQREMEQRRIEQLKVAATAVVIRSPVLFAQDLDGVHSLVKATRRYCDRLPKLIERDKRLGIMAWRDSRPEDRLPREQYGRYFLFRQGLLDITASLGVMDWVLRFHATVLRSLTEGGAKIAHRTASTDRSYRSPEAAAVVMQFKGEVLTFGFSEGYRRVRLDAAEFAKRKKESSFASEYETRPSGNFVFRVQGTENWLRKEWKGTQDKLEGLAEEIVRTMFELAAQQPQVRQEREVKEAAARHAEALRIEAQRRQDARAHQLEKAFAVMEVSTRVQKLQAFLVGLEQQAEELAPPFDERLKVWIAVVQEELVMRGPVQAMLMECLTVPTWATWPPAWWPQDDHSRADDAP